MGRQMASMHELRDRAILSVQRLLEAQGSVFQLSGYNKRKVGALCRHAALTWVGDGRLRTVQSAHQLRVRCAALRSLLGVRVTGASLRRCGMVSCVCSMASVPASPAPSSRPAALGVHCSSSVVSLDRIMNGAYSLSHAPRAPQARDNLELSFVNEADMVFTTLSSTGRRVFERMKNAFDTVLIDEAAQASEVAVLQPLSFGCKRCAEDRVTDLLSARSRS